MAKKNGEESLDVIGLEEILKSIIGLRKDVRLIKTSITADQKPAYTNQEVMEMFKIASATLKKWRDTGLMGYTLVGSVYLYSKEDIEKFLKDNHFDTYDSAKGFIKAVREL
jgi:hypothetical protein